MRDAWELETLEGLEYIASVPEGEVIIGIATHGLDGLYVATEHHLYKLIDDKRLERVQ